MKQAQSQEDETKEKKGIKLLEFASKTADGKSEYFRYAIRERRTCLEMFNDFEITTQVPLDYLIQGIGR